MNKLTKKITSLSKNKEAKTLAGNLAHYLVDRTPIHAWPMSAGRFDIGSLDTYLEACEKFGK